MKRIFLVLLVLLLCSFFVMAKPIKSNGNIGLYNQSLEIPVVDKTGFERIVDVSVVKEGDYYLIDYSVPDELWENDKLKEKDVCEDYFGLDKKKSKKEFNDCSNFLKDYEKGLKVENKKDKVDKDVIKEKKDKGEKLRVKLEKGKDKAVKIGDNSIEVYLDDSEWDFVVTPETTTPYYVGWVSGLRYYKTSVGVSVDENIVVDADSFGANGIDFSLSETNCWIEDYNVDVPIYDKNGENVIGWDYNVPKQRTDCGETNLDSNSMIEFVAGETKTINYYYNSDKLWGKWDWTANIFGNELLIDPYFVASAGTDLNANFD